MWAQFYLTLVLTKSILQHWSSAEQPRKLTFREVSIFDLKYSEDASEGILELTRYLINSTNHNH